MVVHLHVPATSRPRFIFFVTRSPPFGTARCARACADGSFALPEASSTRAHQPPPPFAQRSTDSTTSRHCCLHRRVVGTAKGSELRVAGDCQRLLMMLTSVLLLSQSQFLVFSNDDTECCLCRVAQENGRVSQCGKISLRIQLCVCARVFPSTPVWSLSASPPQHVSQRHT